MRHNNKSYKYSVCSTIDSFAFSWVSCSDITLDPGYCDDNPVYFTDDVVVEFDLTLNTFNGPDSDNFIHIFDIEDNGNKNFFIRYTSQDPAGLYLRYNSPAGVLQNTIKPSNQSLKLNTIYNHKLTISQTNIQWEINGRLKLDTTKTAHITGDIGTLCFPSTGNQHAAASGDKGVISSLKVYPTLPDIPPINPICATSANNLDIIFVVDTSCGLTTDECTIFQQGVADLITTIKQGSQPRIAYIEFADHRSHFLDVTLDDVFWNNDTIVDDSLVRAEYSEYISSIPCYNYTVRTDALSAIDFANTHFYAKETGYIIYQYT